MNRKGYWGERTATIDWCEVNYEITYYIAEFWNTVSNLVMIFLPIYGIYWSYKHIKSAKQSQKNHQTISSQFTVPNTVIWCYLGLMLVGIGSWMFHMTLLYPMQLLDELPMIYLSGVLIYSNYDLILSNYHFFDLTQPKHPSILKQIITSRKIVSALIIVYCLIITFIYLFIWKDPIFHEVAYSLMVGVIIIQNVTLIKKLKSSKRLYLISFIYYAFGFFLWNLDNKFCLNLKTYRNEIQNFFGINPYSLEGNLKTIFLNVIVVLLKSVFEFHSLWHIFTGYATFITILFLTDVHYQFHLKKNNQIHKENIRPIECTMGNMIYYLSNNLIKSHLKQK